ncbi:hypothetical protein CF326_g5644, partial [Tilletia indica]
MVDLTSAPGPLTLPNPLTFQSAVAFLSALRKRPERSPTLVLRAGEYLLENGAISSPRKLGDDLWPVLEQLASAAIDLGRWELAEICIERLGIRFEDSARVGVLQGMLLEGKGEFGKALELYDVLLQKDETNLLVMKRRIALMASLPRSDARGGPQRAIKALLEFIDTVYVDAEAWLQLASLYAAEDMLPQSLYALEELLLLSPQNSFYVLQYAETLYSVGTPAYISRAWREYLRVIEMCPQEAGKGEDHGRRAGPWVRALWGLKACSSYFLNNPTSSAVSKRKGQDESEADESVTPPSPEDIKAIDTLATDLLLNKAYASSGSSAPPSHVREAVRKVLSMISAPEMAAWNSQSEMQTRSIMHGSSAAVPGGKHPRGAFDQQRTSEKAQVPPYGKPPQAGNAGPGYGVTPRASMTSSPFNVPLPTRSQPKNLQPRQHNASPGMTLGAHAPGLSGSAGAARPTHHLPTSSSASSKMQGRHHGPINPTRRPSTAVKPGDAQSHRGILNLSDKEIEAAARSNWVSSSTGAPGPSRPQAAVRDQGFGHLPNQFQKNSTAKRNGWNIANSASASTATSGGGRTPVGGREASTQQRKPLGLSHNDPNEPSETIEIDSTDDDDATDSRTKSVVASPKRRLDNDVLASIPTSRSSLNVVAGETGDDTEDPIDMLPSPNPTTELKTSKQVIHSDAAPGQAPSVYEIDSDTGGEAGSHSSQRGRPHDIRRGKRARSPSTARRSPEIIIDDRPRQLTIAGRSSGVTRPSNSPEITIAGVAQVRLNPPGTGPGSGSDTSPLLSRMGLNGGLGKMTSVQDRKNQKAIDDQAQDDFEMEIVPQPRSAKRARPGNNLEAPKLFSIDNFFLGEGYLPGPHQIILNTHGYAELKLKHSGTVDGCISCSLGPDDFKTVNRANGGAKIPFFRVQVSPGSLKCIALKKLSMEGKFDPMASDPNEIASWICGLIRPSDVADFNAGWQILLKEAGKDKFGHQVLDQNGINSLQEKYEQIMRSPVAKRAKPQQSASTSATTQSFYGKTDPKPRDALEILAQRATGNSSASSASASKKDQAPLPDFTRKNRVLIVPGEKDGVARSQSRSMTRQQTRLEKAEGDPDIEKDMSEAREKAAEAAKVARTTRAKPRLSEADDTQILRWPLQGGPGAISLFRSDFAKLDEGEFLNDTLIEFGLKYILDQKREEGGTGSKLADSMYLYSSFFYKRLSEGKDHLKLYENVRKWTSRVDIFDKDYLVVPINEHLHWYLAIIIRPRLILKRRPKPPSGEEGKRRSKRYNPTLEDTDDEEEKEDGEGSKAAKSKPGSTWRRPATPAGGSDYFSDDSQVSVPASTSGVKRGQTVDDGASQESEEAALVEMDDVNGVAQDKTAKTADASGGNTLLARMNRGVPTSTAEGLSSNGDATSGSDDETSRTRSFAGLLTSNSHPDVRGWLESSRPEQPSLATGRPVQPGRGGPLASTPPHQTRVRAERLLNTGGPDVSGRNAGVHASPVGQAGPSRSRDEDEEVGDLSINPSQISLDRVDNGPDLELSASSSLADPAEDIDRDLDRMDVDPPVSDAPGEDQAMDTEEDPDGNDPGFSFVSSSGPHSSPSVARPRHEANQDGGVDTSSCINNPGRGSLVGGSGLGANGRSGRVPQPILPGQRASSPRPSGSRGQNQGQDLKGVEGILKPPSERAAERPRPQRLRSGTESKAKADTSSASANRSASKQKKAYDPQVPTIIFFDSLSNSHRPAGLVLTRYLKYEAMDKQREKLARVGLEWQDDDPESRKKVLEELPDCNLINAIVPEQPNSCDCGVYLLHFFSRFFSDPDSFEELITNQFQEGVPYRQNQVDSEWKATDGPRQRRFWQDTINKYTADWEKQRKVEEEAREQRKRAAEAAAAAAAESGEGSPAPGTSKNGPEVSARDAIPRSNLDEDTHA